MHDGHIYLLIGPKGSGKSFIGKLIDTQFDIRFLRVEDWVKNLSPQSAAMEDESYLEAVFYEIEHGVRRELKKASPVVFESTGLTTYFDEMFARLSRDFRMTTIGVRADPVCCLERVKSRDQSIHIDIPIDTVKAINDQVLEKNMKTDYILQNNEANLESLKARLKKIIEQRHL